MFGSGKLDIAGVEFVFPMLVGCSVQELMTGLIRVDDHQLDHEDQHTFLFWPSSPR